MARIRDRSSGSSIEKDILFECGEDFGEKSEQLIFSEHKNQLFKIQ